MKKSNFSLLIIVISLFVAGSRTISAQEVVAAYGDEAGSIIRYSAVDGNALSRVQKVFRVGANIYRPSRIAIENSSSYIVVFGERYLARLNASDGSILWIVDAGWTVGYTTYFVADIAVAGGNVFLCNYDSGRRIAKYRASDGALLWSIQYGVQDGWTRQLPVKLAAAGSDSFFALVGNKYLTKLRQSDGAVLFQVSIPLTIYPTTWNFLDLTVGGGAAYTSNLDFNGTVRKFSSSSGAMLWSLSRTYRVGLVWYQPTRLAAVGNGSVMLVFGNRYLARMNAADGTILFTKDISLPVGYIREEPADIAAIPSP